MEKLVAVIDDDDDNREIITAILLDAGFAVRDFRTSADAEHAIAGEHVALVVLDGGMPLPDVNAPTVVVSAALDIVGQAARVGARAWLKKPFALEDLVALVRANAA